MIASTIFAVLLFPAVARVEPIVSPADEFLLRVEATPGPSGKLNKRVDRDEQGRIIHLWLNGVELRPGDLLIVSGFEHLEVLSLAATIVRDEELRYISDLPKLSGLRLIGTEIGDKGLDQLHGAKELRHLCLGASRATPAAVERLKTALPKLQVGYSPR